MSDMATLLDGVTDTCETPSEPRLSTILYGHEAVEELLLKDIKNGRLPHALILSGASGIGKATLAFRLARYLLSGKENDSLFIGADNPVAKRIASGGHMDLKLIEPSFEDENGKKSATRIIRVFQIRKINEFLSQTAAENGWRVVIIDEAELMNNQAQNAVLKILEEPPEQSIFILIASESGKFLPTIHSRCRMIPMSALDDNVMERLLNKFDVPVKEQKNLIKIADGRIGYALELYNNDGMKVYKQVLKIFSNMSELENHALIRKILDNKIDYSLFMEMLINFLAKMAKLSAINKTEEYDEIISCYSAQKWFDLWETTSNNYKHGQIANLDKQTIIMQTLNKIKG